MLTSVLVVLLVFYAGAVCASAYSWLGVWRGAIRFSALRDVTGIGDRAVLRRLFGLTRPDGVYQVTFANVMRHRRPAGIILTDLPVHGLFLAALSWAALNAGAPAAGAIGAAAALHAFVLGGAAACILARSRQAITG